MTHEDQAQAVAALRLQVVALASITGVLVAALRRGGLMTDGREALSASGLADAAAARSEQARAEWNRIATAVWAWTGDHGFGALTTVSRGWPGQARP